MNKADVIIIGSGVLGTSLAYHLGQAGLQAVVLEREPSFAQHASGKNAGMIRQLYRHEQLTEWAARSICDWPAELRSRVWRQTGSLIVGRSIPEHHPHLFEERVSRIHSAHGLIDLPAVYTASDGLIDPSDFCAGLYELIDKKAIRFCFNTEVVSVGRVLNEFQVATASMTTFHAPWVVNAAGAWLNRFLSPAQQVVAQPFARHLLTVDGWDDGYMPEENVGFYWDEHQKWYLRLWNTHSRLVSICDKCTADPDRFMPTHDLLYDVSSKLSVALPDISPQLSIGRSWHCFRMYAGDQLPIWGEDPSERGLFWLGAFGGFGMSTAFAATADAAAYLSGTKVTVSADFSPERVKQPVLQKQVVHA